MGCGNISSIYLKNCRAMFRNLEIAAVCDLDRDRAKAKAAEFGIPKSCSLPELLAMDDIDAVLNLTIPRAHAEVALAALGAGKHLYGEKPLAVNLAEGERIVALAESKSLLVGSAPDTFLGAGLQSCRKLVDELWIGKVLGASAFMLCGGHESWHPDRRARRQPARSHRGLRQRGNPRRARSEYLRRADTPAEEGRLRVLGAAPAFRLRR